MKYVPILLVMLAWNTAAGQAETNLPLPTCYIPLKELVTTCKGAVVATLASVGNPEVGPPGAADYQSRWKSVNVLKGNYPNEVDLTFRVQTLPETRRERMPSVGKRYILITYDTNPNQIAYMFDYTDEKLGEVKALLKK
jgi:hypothetical protein